MQNETPHSYIYSKTGLDYIFNRHISAFKLNKIFLFIGFLNGCFDVFDPFQIVTDYETQNFSIFD